MTDRQKMADDWLNRNYVEWKEVEALKLRLEMSESMLSSGVSKMTRSESQVDHVDNVQEAKQVEASYLRDIVEKRIRSLDIGDAQTIQVIGHVASSELRMILLRRYIFRWSWSRIARELGYDRRSIYRKKVEALDEVAMYIAAQI